MFSYLPMVPGSALSRRALGFSSPRLIPATTQSHLRRTLPSWLGSSATCLDMFRTAVLVLTTGTSHVFPSVTTPRCLPSRILPGTSTRGSYVVGVNVSRTVHRKTEQTRQLLTVMLRIVMRSPWMRRPSGGFATPVVSYYLNYPPLQQSCPFRKTYPGRLRTTRYW